MKTAVIITLLLLLLVLAQPVWALSDDFTSTPPLTKEDVLNIIRENPLVIIETVESYFENKDKEKQVEILSKAFKEEQKVILVEFGDYQCPFCQRVQPIVEEFLAQHPEIKFYYKQYPLEFHPLAMPASKLAVSADPEQFLAVQKELYHGELSESRLADIQARYHIELKPEADQIIRADQELGKQLGVDSTPTFFLFNPQNLQVATIRGALPLSEFNDQLQTIAKE